MINQLQGLLHTSKEETTESTQAAKPSTRTGDSSQRDQSVGRTGQRSLKIDLEPKMPLILSVDQAYQEYKDVNFMGPRAQLKVEMFEGITAPATGAGARESPGAACAASSGLGAPKEQRQLRGSAGDQMISGRGILKSRYN